MKVVAGDWRANSPVSIRNTLTGRPKAFRFQKWLLSDDVRVDLVESMEMVTADNKASIVGKAAWGVAGAVLLGGVGALAGVLGGGNGKEVVFAVRFKDGRKALIQCNSKESKQLLAVQFAV